MTQTHLQCLSQLLSRCRLGAGQPGQAAAKRHQIGAVRCADESDSAERSACQLHQSSSVGAYRWIGGHARGGSCSGEESDVVCVSQGCV